MSAHPTTETYGKPVMQSFVNICNGGPRVSIPEDHLGKLLYAKLIYTVERDDQRFIHVTERGYDLAGQLHEGRDF